MRHMRIAYIAVALASLVIGVSACSGSDERAVVIRVGDNAITKATVDHWTGVVRRGGAFTAFRGEPEGGTARQRAVALLITCEWLIAEAAREGLTVSRKVIAEAMAERTQGQAGVEFRKRLETTGQTVAGFELELRAELSLEAIQRALARRINTITPSEITAFYRDNLVSFGGTQEARVVDIIEKLPSASAATALVKRVGTGQRFTALAYHKEIVLSPGVLNGPATKKAVDYAIFAAHPGVVSRPMRFLEGWAVFVVRKVIPARSEPLDKVHDAVAADLRTQRKREVEDTFGQEYRARWTAVTRCRSGYVAAGCVEFRGDLSVHEDPFLEH
jgi:parvulin-like peptidyl-prolyl isomerase